MIKEYEKRLKAAVDAALGNQRTEATVDVGDVLEILHTVHAYRMYEQRRVDALVWTDEKPTVPGWYWWRTDSLPPHIIAIGREGTQWVVSFTAATGYSDRIPFGQFAGPIPEPL